ncbi:hypothetical protein BCY91_15895 [Pelobium manganitolerans]|uniref:Uncharacterized protein n=1 Tax=Pelobium manganitolerans TaxID=1842495 RepID=A0A419S8T3_9SPHI|nr:hypothetical protein BCY91_15895 [Pelobium manganitolerans]
MPNKSKTSYNLYPRALHCIPLAQMPDKYYSNMMLKPSINNLYFLSKNLYINILKIIYRYKNSFKINVY